MKRWRIILVAVLVAAGCQSPPPTTTTVSTESGQAVYRGDMPVYAPTTWQNGPGGATPIDADGLNKMEQGILSAHEAQEWASLTDDLLLYAPPHLTNWQVYDANTYGTHTMPDPTADYIIRINPNAMNGQPAGKVSGTGGLKIVGGRNIIIVGGEVEIPDTVTFTSTEQYKLRGLSFNDQTGTVYVEGVALTGPYLSEGVQLNAPRADFIFQNIWMDELQSFAGAGGGHTSAPTDRFHADAFQSDGGFRSLRIDRLYASTTYQGIFLKNESGVSNGPAILSRIHIVGTDASAVRWGFAQSSSSIPVTLRHVYLQMAHPTVGSWVLPQVGSAEPRTAYRAGDHIWFHPATGINGLVTTTAPPSSTVVRANVGASYTPKGFALPPAIPTVQQFALAANRSTSNTTVTASATFSEFGGETTRQPIDWSNATEARLRVAITPSGTAAAGEIGVWFSPTWAKGTVELGLTGPVAVGLVDTGWVSIPQEARREGALSIGGRNGDGGTLATGQWNLHFR